MAPRWMSSGQSAWGLSSERAVGTGTLIGIALVLLLIGSLIGYAVRGVGDRNPAGSVSQEELANSAVIDPRVAAMAAAEQSPEGAVKAATSFLAGLPELSLLSTAEQATIINDIVAPGADPAVAQNLRTLLLSARSLVLPNSQARLEAKLITAPVSYRVTMQGNDRATVEVWAVRVYLNAQGAQLSSLWSTNDVGLAYSGNKWRVTRFVPRSGPNPPVESGTPPGSYGEAAAVLRGGFAYRYALAP